MGGLGVVIGIRGRSAEAVWQEIYGAWPERLDGP